MQLNLFLVCGGTLLGYFHWIWYFLHSYAECITWWNPRQTRATIMTVLILSKNRGLFVFAIDCPTLNASLSRALIKCIYTQTLPWSLSTQITSDHWRPTPKQQPSRTQLQPYQPVSGLSTVVLHSDVAQRIHKRHAQTSRSVAVFNVYEASWHLLSSGWPDSRSCAFMLQLNRKRISNALQDAPAQRRPSSASAFHRSPTLYRKRSTPCKYISLAMKRVIKIRQWVTR